MAYYERDIDQFLVTFFTPEAKNEAFNQAKPDAGVASGDVLSEVRRAVFPQLSSMMAEASRPDGPCSGHSVGRLVPQQHTRLLSVPALRLAALEPGVPLAPVWIPISSQA